MSAILVLVYISFVAKIMQGASDAGLIPMFFPDYKPVNDPETRAKNERSGQRT